MREEKCISKVRRRKYISYRGDVGIAAPNGLNRNFSASAPNQKWVTDVTEFKINDTKQYLSPIIDLYSGEIISYEVKSAPVIGLVTDMLDKALAKIETERPLIHSDQGWHYRHKSYQKRLSQRGLEQSMSRKGNCLDNAVAENFFGHFKEEFLKEAKFENIPHFKKELELYMHWFNNERIQLKRKGLSPVEYRTQSFATLTPAPD